MLLPRLNAQAELGGLGSHSIATNPHTDIHAKGNKMYCRIYTAPLKSKPRPQPTSLEIQHCQEVQRQSPSLRRAGHLVLQVTEL